MDSKPSFKDRKKLNLKVKHEFQRWLLKQVLVAVVLSAVIAAVVLYFYARQEVIDSFFDAHVKIRRVSDLLLPVIAAASAVSLCVGIFLAMFLPQKIAGPIYRIERDLRAIESGDLTTKVQLRTEDTLQDFAETVSQTVGAVRGRVSAVKDNCRQLELAIVAGDKEKIAALLAVQKEQFEKLKT
ncbi:MAG TPA: methyl-accepting chemotaxis protein [Malonomonas sp.]